MSAGVGEVRGGEVHDALLGDELDGSLDLRVYVSMVFLEVTRVFAQYVRQAWSQ